MLAAMTTSAELFARAVEAMPGGNTRSTLYIPPVPPYARRGTGCRLVDEDGHETFDLQSNYTTLVHGHRHPVVMAAAMAAIEDGTCFGLPSRHDVALAERISERVPVVERLRFTNSGSEAVMMAFRTARALTGKNGILRFEGSYHGIYDAALPAGAAGIPDVVYGDLYDTPVADEAAFLQALDEHGDRLACVIIDLMPNRAGLKPVPQAFADLVRAETTRRGILLIVDEVITLRLGLSGLHGRYGITPDLVTMGKIIGGGFAVGAWGGPADVMGVLDPRRAGNVPHAGTFSANPVTCAAGLAALDLLDQAGDRPHQRPRRPAARGRGGDWATTWPAPARCSGCPTSSATTTPGGGSTTRGLLVATNGLCSLSTVMTEADVEEIAARFAAARE